MKILKKEIHYFVNIKIGEYEFNDIILDIYTIDIDSYISITNKIIYLYIQ